MTPDTPEFTRGLIWVESMPPHHHRRISLSTSGSPHPDKMQRHYGGSCCLRPRGYLGFTCTPLLHRAEGQGKGGRDPGSLGTAWRRNRIGPSSHSSRLPSGTMSTEPGRPLAFHYRASKSSSPGKYVAIKINRPALSAEHNANYLWAVCAIFIIVQAPGA